MRVTSSMYYKNIQAESSRANERLFDVNKQISSGLKIQYAHDDVSVFTETMRLDNELTSLGQIAKSAESGYKMSTQADTALNEFQTTMDRTKTLLIQASNSAQSDVSRDAIAVELRGLEEHFKNLSNTSINGQFIFSGSAVDVRPISSDGKYMGNDVSMNSFVGAGAQQKYNLTGADLFLGEEASVKRTVTSNVPQYNLSAKYPDFSDPLNISTTVDKIITVDDTIRDLMGDIDNDPYDTANHFYLSGAKSDGTSFNKHISMSGSNSVDELLTQIGNAYGNTSDLKLVNVSLTDYGEIVVEDKRKGSSKLDFHMVGAVDYSVKIPIDNQIQTRKIDPSFATPTAQLNTLTFSDFSPIEGSLLAINVNGQPFTSSVNINAAAPRNVSDLVLDLVNQINAYDFGDGAGNTFTLDTTTIIPNTPTSSFTMKANTAETPFSVTLDGSSDTLILTNDPTMLSDPGVPEISTITVDPSAAFDIGDTYTIDIDNLGAVSYEVKDGDGAQEVASGLVAAINSSSLATNALATDNGDGTYTLTEVTSLPGDPVFGLTIALGGSNATTIPSNEQIQTENIDIPFTGPTAQLNTLTFTDAIPENGDTITVELNGQVFTSDIRDDTNPMLTDMSDLVTNLVDKINAFDFGNGTGNTFTLVDTTNATDTSPGIFTIESQTAGTSFNIINEGGSGDSVSALNDPTTPNDPGIGEVNTIIVDSSAAFTADSIYSVDINGIAKVSYTVQPGDTNIEVAAGLTSAINSSSLASEVNAVDNGDGTYTLTEIIADGDPATGLTIEFSGSVPSDFGDDSANINDKMYAKTGSINNLDFGETNFDKIMSGTTTAKNQNLYVKEFVKSPYESADILGLESATFDMSGPVVAGDTLSLIVDNGDGTTTSYSQLFDTDATITYDALKTQIELDNDFTVQIDPATDTITLNSTFQGLAKGVSIDTPLVNNNLAINVITTETETTVSALESAEFAMSRPVEGNGINDDTLTISVNNGDGTISSYSQKFVTDAITTYESLKTKIEIDKNFTVGIDLATDTITLNSTFQGLANGVSVNTPLANDDGSGAGIVNVTANQTAVDITTKINALLYDKTQFTKEGSILSSSIPQIIRGTNAFASPSTKISEVADLSQGKVGTLDGTQFTLSGTDTSGNKYTAEIDFASSGSTFTVDGNTYDIFNIQNPRAAVNADDMTYQQFMDVTNMIVTNNLPTANTEAGYDAAIRSSEVSGSTYLSYDGKIQFKDENHSDTKASLAIYDSNSGDFTLNVDSNGDGTKDKTTSSVMTFNSNNALTIRDAKTDFFKNLNEIITAVENHKIYPDSESGDMRSVGMENAISMIDDLMEHVSRSHALVGSQSNSLNNSLERAQLLEISTMTLRSSVIDTDIAEASLNLTQLSLSYQAMLSTVAKVSQLSLVNYL